MKKTYRFVEIYNSHYLNLKNGHYFVYSPKNRGLNFIIIGHPGVFKIIKTNDLLYNYNFDYRIYEKNL